MRFLITRPEEDAEPLARAVRALGHDAIIDSMLRITAFDDVQLDTDGVQALLFSSANGVRAFSDISLNRRVPVYTVGEASAAVAREMGFRRVFAAGGDIAALAQLVTESLKPEEGILMHVSGTVVARELKDLLQKESFNVFRVRLYESEPATQLGEHTIAHFNKGEVDGVLFYSPRTAQIFTDLVVENRLTEACRRVRALCLSEAVAEVADKLPWRAVKVADAPSQDAMLSLLAQ
ncbi:MAG: uroporphyrinogen-III synthase [Alphaproteobacteria bacterium]|nr:uroporphyrinogen-III synthase [Alphaproteobacteria bacterium]